MLKNKLKQIKLDNKFYDRLQVAVWKIHKDLPSDQFFHFLSNFSYFEQSIMLLLLLDLSVEEVAEYKEINSVRVKQAITVIKDDPVWEKVWL
jgi:hypothetical protein